MIQTESAQANKKIEPTKEAVRRRAWEFIRSRGMYGATADELAVAFDCSHNHVAPRITELKREGRIIATAQRRRTRSGCSARVLVAKGITGQASLPL